MQSRYISYIFIYRPTLRRASPSAEGGGTWGIPLLPKILAFHPMSTPVFCPANVAFVIFMQFSAILRRLYPHKSNPFGKPCYVSFPDQGNYFLQSKVKFQLQMLLYY